MAKAKTLDQAIYELLNRYSDAMEVAAEYATKKAEEDFYNHSMKFLQQYYEQYEPTKHGYKRTESLQHAFVKFSNVLNVLPMFKNWEILHKHPDTSILKVIKCFVNTAIT